MTGGSYRRDCWACEASITMAARYCPHCGEVQPHEGDDAEIVTDGGEDLDHIYVGRIPGMWRWSPDYDTVAEWAGGEENVSIMHTRGREYVLDLSEDHPFECSMNCRYNCGHVAYGPPRRLPNGCPECKPVVTDGGTDRFEASVDLDDEYAHRAVVHNFDDVILRVTGTNIEDEDGIDLKLSQLAPRDDAVLELIEDDQVHARYIQGGDRP